MAEPSRDANQGTPKPTIQTPVQIAPFVDVLGIDGAIEFLLEFGGAELKFARNPRETSQLSQLVGIDNARALGVAAARLPRRIPLAKRWLAMQLKSQGLSIAEIARKLRVQDKTASAFLKGKGYGPTVEERQQRSDDRQLPLF
jgi:hypothetical protein